MYLIVHCQFDLYRLITVLDCRVLRHDANMRRTNSRRQPGRVQNHIDALSGLSPHRLQVQPSRSRGLQRRRPFEGVRACTHDLEVE